MQLIKNMRRNRPDIYISTHLVDKLSAGFSFYAVGPNVSIIFNHKTIICSKFDRLISFLHICYILYIVQYEKTANNHENAMIAPPQSF
jgi:hypothetical protein